MAAFSPFMWLRLCEHHAIHLQVTSPPTLRMSQKVHHLGLLVVSLVLNRLQNRMYFLVRESSHSIVFATSVVSSIYKVWCRPSCPVPH